MCLENRFPSKPAESLAYANDDDVVIYAACVVRCHPRSPFPGAHARLHCALATPKAAAAEPEQAPQLYNTAEHWVSSQYSTDPGCGTYLMTTFTIVA